MLSIRSGPTASRRWDEIGPRARPGLAPTPAGIYTPPRSFQGRTLNSPCLEVVGSAPSGLLAMPKFASNELTEDLHRRLCGRFVDEYTDRVILIHTVDPDGWAHPAILSYFEVVAKDRQNIRLATYQSSNTTRHMRQTGKVTLSVFDERVTYYVKGTASELRRRMQSASENSKLNVRVEQVLVDQADPVLEPGAYIAGGITYVNPNLGAGREKRAAILKELMQ